MRHLVQDRPVDFSSAVDDTVTYSELRRDFEFLGLDSMPVNDENLYPCSVFLLAMVDDVRTFVEEFQFLTCTHLHSLCSQHGLLTSRGEHHTSLVDALHLHIVCMCPHQVNLFRMLQSSRWNVVLRALSPPQVRTSTEHRAVRVCLSADDWGHGGTRHLDTSLDEKTVCVTLPQPAGAVMRVMATVSVAVAASSSFSPRRSSVVLVLIMCTRAERRTLLAHSFFSLPATAVCTLRPPPVLDRIPCTHPTCRH